MVCLHLGAFGTTVDSLGGFLLAQLEGLAICVDVIQAATEGALISTESQIADSLVNLVQVVGEISD